jgi:predicted ATP-binding protein involved in virulence
MLTELVVDNFAIIEHLELKFGPGLITFTGETGAGKSIIIDAVQALMGERADTTFVRSGSERAIVEGVFQFPPATRQPLIEILEREDLLTVTQKRPASARLAYPWSNCGKSTRVSTGACSKLPESWRSCSTPNRKTQGVAMCWPSRSTRSRRLT